MQNKLNRIKLPTTNFNTFLCCIRILHTNGSESDSTGFDRIRPDGPGMDRTGNCFSSCIRPANWDKGLVLGMAAWGANLIQPQSGLKLDWRNIRHATRNHISHVWRGPREASEQFPETPKFHRFPPASRTASPSRLHPGRHLQCG